MNKERGVIERRGREMVLNVYEYFVAEKESCKELLETLSLMLRNAQGCFADEVVLPRKCLEEVVSHYRNTTRITERVVAATHINKNTVSKIRREGEEAKINKTTIEMPVKKPRGKKNFFGSEGLLELRNIIHSMFIVKKEAFMLNKLLTIARQDLNYQGSKTTLRRILDDLGFEIHKDTVKGVFTLTEKPNYDNQNNMKNRDKNFLAQKKKTLNAVRECNPLRGGDTYLDSCGAVHIDEEKDLTTETDDCNLDAEENSNSSIEEFPVKIRRENYVEAEANDEVMEEEYLEEFEDYDLSPPHVSRNVTL